MHFSELTKTVKMVSLKYNCKERNRNEWTKEGKKEKKKMKEEYRGRKEKLKARGKKHCVRTYLYSWFLWSTHLQNTLHHTCKCTNLQCWYSSSWRSSHLYHYIRRYLNERKRQISRLTFLTFIFFREVRSSVMFCPSNYEMYVIRDYIRNFRYQEWK